MRFTDSHEWVRTEESGLMCVGISNHAQKELGEVVFVKLPEVGTEVKAGEEVAVLESTKAAADIYTPVSGVIVYVNSALKDTPSLINTSPEQEGWLFQVQATNLTELDTLHGKEAYLSNLGY